MAVTPDDLLAPVGPVDPSLFPGEGSNVLRKRLQAYLTNAAQEPAVLAASADLRDAMTKAHALYQAFSAVHIRMSAQPMTLTVAEKGGHSYTMEQIRNMRDLATKYLNDFQSMTVTVGTIRPGATPGTMSVRTSVEW